MPDERRSPPPEGREGRAKELFLDALELEGAERVAFLQRLGREDAPLRARVEQLLGAHAGADALFEAVPDLTEGLRDAVRGPRPDPGAVLGDYELLEEIASGASGVVWRARQRSLDRVVALKLLRAGRLAGARQVERFRAEAGAAARLDHPHLVPVHEVGEHEGQPFFSMKWVEGGSLADRGARPWDPEQAARLAATVARAVHHAHQRGLLHRDLKPSNVLLDAAGQPHVADFGIAKRLDGDTQETGTQVLAGTPAYMAPEQAEPGGELTVATDVWALGCILYELLCGRPAFRGDSVTEVLLAIRDREPTRPRELRPGLPRDLETIVLTCLRKQPDRRYASAAALADDLERWLAHEPILARRPTPAERVLLAWRRAPVVSTLALLVGLLVLALAIGASWTSVELRSRLRDSWLEQARATRLAGQPGRREQALELLGRAAAVRPGQDLRDEAIACLALSDLALERQWRRPEGMRGADLSPDLTRWAWGSDDGTIHVVGVESGRDIAQLRSGLLPNAMRFSPDGRLLAVKYDRRDRPGPVRTTIWDVDAGVPLAELDEEIGYDAFDIDPSGRRVAAVTLGGQLLVHDLQRGVEELRLDLGARAGSLRFRPDGAALAIGVGGDLRVLQVRALPGGELLASREIDGPPFMVDWSADGEQVALACGDYRGYLWEPSQDLLRATFEGHAAEVVEIHLSSSLPLAVTYSWDETTRLWDTETGEQLVSISAPPLRISADGLRLAAQTNEVLGIWRLEHGGALESLRGHAGKSPRRVAISPDGRLLVSSGEDGALLWAAEGGRLLRRLSSARVEGVAFLPGDGGLLTCGSDGLQLRPLPGLDPPRTLLAGSFSSLDVTADGRLAALLGTGELRVVGLEGLQVRAVIASPPGLSGVELSPDGRWAASSSFHGAGVHVWDVSSGAQVAHLLPELETVVSAFSPDGSVLATSDRGDFRLWRVGRWDEVLRTQRRRPYTGGGEALAFTPDGTRLAGVDLNGTITFLDARTGERRATLEPPSPQPIAAFGFDRDGSLLAVACPSNRVQVWDLGEISRQLEGLRLGGW